MSISAIGMLQLAEDIPPELAAETIEEVRPRGIFRLSEPIEEVLADRIE